MGVRHSQATVYFGLLPGDVSKVQTARPEWAKNILGFQPALLDF